MIVCEGEYNGGSEKIKEYIVGFRG